VRLAVAVLAAVAMLGVAGQAAAALPLRTALNENGELATPDAALFLKRIRSSGADMLRLPVPWGAIAASRPTNPANPNDPVYDWSVFDERVRLLLSNGVEPLVIIGLSPPWALKERPGAPDPREAGLFARAAAEHYSGRTPGVPRIRFWQVLNEPNVSSYFAPPFRAGRPYSPGLYRPIVNAVASAVHAVRSDNVVVAGGLSPFTVDYGKNSVRTIGPLAFMRSLLCMSKGSRPKPTCKTKVEFDIWSHHPYTSGGPTHHAYHPDDVSLGDLPEMKRLLRAAVAARHVAAPRGVRFWVTEFSWDSNPPDRYAVPTRLLARWVSQALHVMWRNGIDLVAWLQMRDSPMSDPVQSGLYYRGSTMLRDRPKPALTAFRFPLVALQKARRTVVWGRTPESRPAQVVVERKSSGGWRRVAVLRANTRGIFTTRLPRQSARYLRARIAGAKSLPFSLATVPDRFVRPFGCGICPPR
jgi:hypothetical protein